MGKYTGVNHFNNEFVVLNTSFDSSGHLGADLRAMIFCMTIPSLMTAEVRAPDEFLVTIYEGTCSSIWTLIRLRFKPWLSGGESFQRLRFPVAL